MSMCVMCHICDHLEKLSQGQIDCQNIQLAISQQPLKIQTSQSQSKSVTV